MESSLEEVGGKPRRRTIDTFLDVRLLREGEETPVGPFRLACRQTIHSIPCIALKCAAGERCLGYSADTRFDPSLLEWLADAHVILHEATDSGAMHTRLAELLTVRPELRKKLRLIHYPDTFEPDNSPIPGLRQGTVLEV
jgi:ribonuclease BN (tRNA processing enzyme)